MIRDPKQGRCSAYLRTHLSISTTCSEWQYDPLRIGIRALAQLNCEEFEYTPIAARMDSSMARQVSRGLLDVVPMTSKAMSHAESIARRRRRLSLDYQDLTHAWLDARGGGSHGTTRALSRCFSAVRRQFLPHYFLSPPRWRVWIRQLVKERALPDFCVIGPVKSGTSDLAVTLMSHPNVLHSMVKEFHSADPLSWRPFYPTRRAVKRHERRYGVALCPLVAPLLHYVHVPIVLAALCPNAKLVITLRNPVDLVFSEWKWNVLHRQQQLVDTVPFLATFPTYVDKALELFPEAPAPFFPGLHAGIYTTCVAHWLRAFGDQNVRIFDVAEYFEDRGLFVAKLEEFLGLPHYPLPQELPVTNRNPIQTLAPTPEASERLREFFDPYNRSLWNVIGTAYSW